MCKKTTIKHIASKLNSLNFIAVICLVKGVNRLSDKNIQLEKMEYLLLNFLSNRGNKFSDNDFTSPKPEESRNQTDKNLKR